MASLAAALPLATAGTANANPASGRVKLAGNASCERFEDASVTEVSITPRGRSAKAVQLSGEDVQEAYSLTFTNIPKSKRMQANAHGQLRGRRRPAAHLQQEHHDHEAGGLHGNPSRQPRLAVLSGEVVYR
ncbi:hypothetical protein ACFV2Q_37490 [Streptomyces sp. NPDC059650]|uniref:hypothetical protein n=1 Tax=Streptomyces sp. NPDC059650 TaxID=3346896 RepID=UPI0036A3206D